MNDQGTDLPGLFTDRTTDYQEYNPSVVVNWTFSIHICVVSCQCYDILTSSLRLKCICVN
jgi:hypothetical protein